MSGDFQEYLDQLKPTLGEAFQSEMSLLVGWLPLKDSASLAGVNAGKKIRGGLACMISQALGGRLESALPGAVAIELIHAATLIHDDFVDQDILRRNRPAVWTLEGARRAVLIGDVIFAGAIKKMSDCGREEGLTVSDAIARVSMGALHEPLECSVLAGELDSGRLDGNRYQQIIHLKTGVLFGAACRLGAIAAGAGVHLRESSCRFGLRLGEAYQIADDLQDLIMYRRRRSIQPEQLAPLTPALLYFVNEMRPSILSLLRGNGPALDHATLQWMDLAAALMEKEIEVRLKAAVSEIEAIFPKNGYGELARKTPWSLIRMFNSP